MTLHQPTEGLVLWIIYGQSLSRGYQGNPRLTKTTPAPDLYMLGQSIHDNAGVTTTWLPVGGSAALSPLVATVVNTATGALYSDAEVEALADNAVAWGETSGEGMLAQLRRAWLRARGRPDGDATNKWVAVSAGIQSQSIAALSEGASPEYYNRIRDVIALGQAQATALGVTFSVGGVIYNQGEADYTAGTAQATCESGLTALIASLRATVAAATSQTGTLPIFLMQTGGQWAIDTLDLAVAKAQIAVSQAVPGVFIVGNNATYVDKDGIGNHLTSNGYRHAGCQIGKVATRVLIDGAGWECTRAIRWVYRNLTLVGLFHAPVPPLRFGSPYTGQTVSPAASAANRGIRAFDASGEIALTNVLVQGQQLVTATMSRTVSGALKIWLGRLEGQAGAVAICDSDQTRLACTYDYTGGSGQLAGENIAALVGLSYPAANFALADVLTATAA